MEVRRPWGMNLLFESPEGIQIKERPCAGRTNQLNTQVGPVHMATWEVDGPSLHPTASDPATANSTLWRPAASRHWATCRRLAWCNKCRPWKEKRRERSITKVRHSHETAKEQPGRSSTRKQREIPRLTALRPHSQPELAHPLLLFKCVPSQFHAAPEWRPQVHHLWMIHLWMRQFQMYKMDPARGSNVQKFFLLDR